jgi:hypothetical protein
MKLLQGRQGARTQRLSTVSLLSLLVIAVQPARALSQKFEESLKQRFLGEAPARWVEYAQRSEMLQGKLTSHMVDDQGTRELLIAEYRTNGKARLCTYERKPENHPLPDNHPVTLYAANPKYAFCLQRPSENSAWVLVQYIDLSKETLPELWKSRFEGFHSEATLLILVVSQPLLEILQNPSFEVQDCRTVQLGADEVVEVSCTFEQSDGPGRRPGRVTGTIHVDPKRFWCLRSADLVAHFKDDKRFKSGTTKLRVSELGESAESVPFPKKFEIHRNFISHSGEIVEGHAQTEYELILPSHLPAEEEFTLSAFGLPEPIGVEWKKPTRWHLWLALAGTACLVLAIGLRFALRRGSADLSGVPGPK